MCLLIHEHALKMLIMAILDVKYINIYLKGHDSFYDYLKKIDIMSLSCERFLKVHK